MLQSAMGKAKAHIVFTNQIKCFLLKTEMFWCFAGDACEEIDPCFESPCDNGGQCMRVGAGYRCECEPEYTGETCEVAVVCADNPCRNNGVCLPVTGGGLVCECTAAYTGECCFLYLHFRRVWQHRP